jgi:hypothetical protein
MNSSIVEYVAPGLAARRRALDELACADARALGVACEPVSLVEEVSPPELQLAVPRGRRGPFGVRDRGAQVVAGERPLRRDEAVSDRPLGHEAVLVVLREQHGVVLAHLLQPPGRAAVRGGAVGLCQQRIGAVA